VNWRNEGYDPFDEGRDVAKGRLRAGTEAVAVPPSIYDPVAELAKRFLNATRRGTDPVHYVRGKIVFGAFSRGLLDRIREQTGRVFHPLAPDYSSMVPACALADRGLDVGRPLLVSYNSGRSNGRLQSLDASYAKRFIEASDPAILDALPIPGLYASQHNAVAYDLVSSAARCQAGTTPSLDLPNLLRRAREDLGAVAWANPAERDAQYAILERAEAEHGISPAPAAEPPRRTAGAALAGALRRIVPAKSSGQVFTSPLEAARAADEYYSVGAQT
jgi:hypothetical protein